MTQDGRMVHHGYARPGYGYIIGDCYGVGRKPFPAVDAVREYLGMTRHDLEVIGKALETLPEQETVSRASRWRGDPARTFVKAECSPGGMGG